MLSTVRACRLPGGTCTCLVCRSPRPLGSLPLLPLEPRRVSRTPGLPTGLCQAQAPPLRAVLPAAPSEELSEGEAGGHMPLRVYPGRSLAEGF